MQAFILICEDHNNALCAADQADTLNTWLAKCVALLASPQHEFRAGAIHCVKHFILRCNIPDQYDTPRPSNTLRAGFRDLKIWTIPTFSTPGPALHPAT